MQTLKTLGVIFDSELKFKDYWKETTRKANQKLYAINRIRNSLPFVSRKKLGQGLVLSRITYCLEAVSCCPKNVLRGPRKTINRLARSTTGRWHWEETRKSLEETGWLSLHTLILYRSYIFARKLMTRKDPIRLLSKFAERDVLDN